MSEIVFPRRVNRSRWLACLLLVISMGLGFTPVVAGVRISPFSEGNSSASVSGYDAGLHNYLYANANPVGYFDPSGHMTLGEIVTAAQISIGLQLARIGPAFALGGAAIGKVWNALGAAAQNAAQSVMMLFPRIDISQQVRVANRVIDFSLRVGEDIALLEAKYKMPSRVGDSMTRLVGQLNAAVGANQGQVVLWTYKAPTTAEIQLLYQQMGVQASRVQMVNGVDGLYRWIQYFFKMEGSG